MASRRLKRPPRTSCLASCLHGCCSSGGCRHWLRRSDALRQRTMLRKHRQKRGSMEVSLPAHLML